MVVFSLKINIIYFWYFVQNVGCVKRTFTFLSLKYFVQNIKHIKQELKYIVQYINFEK